MKIKTPNLVTTIILVIIWLALSILIAKDTIYIFKRDKFAGILEIILYIVYLLPVGIILFAILFGINVCLHLPIPITIR